MVVVGIEASVHCEICEHMQTIVHAVLHDPIEVNTHSDRVVAWSTYLVLECLCKNLQCVSDSIEKTARNT